MTDFTPSMTLVQAARGFMAACEGNDTVAHALTLVAQYADTFQGEPWWRPLGDPRAQVNAAWRSLNRWWRELRAAEVRASLPPRRAPREALRFGGYVWRRARKARYIDALDRCVPGSYGCRQ